jgi:hypothetical protein
MDFSYFDKIADRLDRIGTTFDTLTREKRELNRVCYELEVALKSSGAAVDLLDPTTLVAEHEALRNKHTALIDERDRLVMERELLRTRIHSLVTRCDEALSAAKDEE